MSNAYFIGVDVGTGSARAALVTDNGKIVKTAVQSIQTWNPQQDFYEQSSDDIWNACVTCIKKVAEGVNPDDVKGLGFDATCSLVALDKSGNPLSVSPSGNDRQNVILWLDHRASGEAAKINKLSHSVLKYVGGKISLEMETPKLLWLKTHLPKQWAKVGLFFDLPDFLTWKATSCETRSLCSLVCKWTYDGQAGWSPSYFQEIGLGDLQEDNWRKIGATVLSPGSPVGQGLSKQAAKELGLKFGTPVGTSIIDAHAGGLGLVGCRAGVNPDFSTRLSLICGTSTCHMAVANKPVFTPGVWGPYFSAMVPGMWLNEGGQSATGKLIDHVIDSHPATATIKGKIGEMHIQTYLSNLLKDLAKKANLDNVAFLTRDLHVWPDFHGNRSPIADPTLKGAVSGLTLAEDEESLALLYLATVQALAYGTRHILESLIKSGHFIESVLICGGLSKNYLFTQTQADVVNLPVVCPEEIESVLLGSAILGACAAKYFPDMTTAIKSMGGKGKVVSPNPSIMDYHNKKYKVFLAMYEHQVQYRTIMSQ
ncbi:FGGY carbohydrate kinase domain-containing protein [Tribolium castaneum]|uniref:FGGY carbohydrate kinase domain-containing protein n=1 Tax=Tribolium castaneum TaxID=7070 RepID=D6WZ71_TRICA|nr:PREDICTED: FGGY carbohydrate kinase domain-containing protein [Tribolium castaneum]EFA09750.1 FGGY carbohydrate kinase domain-containing protein-like Protein [Tribolium castaneum]|eukprot:XP_974615.1 PREDICTED: FGGY carbohydrate kinase domain-containing protein [Tribolium castaneum]